MAASIDKLTDGLNTPSSASTISKSDLESSTTWVASVFEDPILAK